MQTLDQKTNISSYNITRYKEFLNVFLILARRGGQICSIFRFIAYQSDFSLDGLAKYLPTFQYLPPNIGPGLN